MKHRLDSALNAVAIHVHDLQGRGVWVAYGQRAIALALLAVLALAAGFVLTGYGGDGSKGKTTLASAGEIALVDITVTEDAFDAPDGISGGLTRIRLHNASRGNHQAQLVRLKDGATLAQFVAALEIPNFATAKSEIEALVQALKDGWIAGAALDVFQQEPLSAESELWGLENVILTPHISGGTPRYMERAVELFCDNLRRYLVGEPLRNVVDPERGY